MKFCLIFFSYTRRLTSPHQLSFLSHRDPAESLEPRLPFTGSQKTVRFCQESYPTIAAGSLLNPDVEYPEFLTTLWIARLFWTVPITQERKNGSVRRTWWPIRRKWCVPGIITNHLQTNETMKNTYWSVHLAVAIEAISLVPCTIILIKKLASRRLWKSNGTIPRSRRSRREMFDKWNCKKIV